MKMMLVLLTGTVLSLVAVQFAFHVLRTGATRKGKTEATVADIARSQGAELICDPHKHSLAEKALIHTSGNVLYCKLSDVKHSVGFDLLVPSTHPDPEMRELENHLEAENFVQMLMMAKDSESLGALQLEWSYAALSLLLNNAHRFPPSILPYAFMPDSREFAALMRGAHTRDREKFETLRAYSPKALRAEVGSTYRLFKTVFGSPIFSAWSRGGFDLAKFYQNNGKAILERGDECGDPTMRMLMGAITFQTIKIGVKRKSPHPVIRIRADEAVNAGLDFPHLVKATAETAKSGVFVEFLVQNHNFRNKKADEILQNCLRHEWFCCPLYSLAREAAIDVLSGLRLQPGESRAEKLADLTDDIQNLDPGWRWVRDPSGSRREYVPMLENPWPDWPGLRAAKLENKLSKMYQRSEFIRQAPPSPGSPSETPDGNGRSTTPSPTTSSPEDGSAAARLKRLRGKPPATS